jgi:hypothetical protein
LVEQLMGRIEGGGGRLRHIGEANNAGEHFSSPPAIRPLALMDIRGSGPNHGSELFALTKSRVSPIPGSTGLHHAIVTRWP